MAFTTPPPATQLPNTPNFDPRKSSVKSTNSMPKRVSGLSMPQRFSASSKEIRLNGVGMSMLRAVFQTRFSSPSMSA